MRQSNLLMLAKDLRYIEEDKYKYLSDKCSEIGKLLNGLIRNLSTSMESENK